MAKEMAREITLIAGLDYGLTFGNTIYMEQVDLSGLEADLLQAIVRTCEREPELAEKMTADSPLIGPDSLLGLDSLDAVEIVALIQAEYGVRISSKETSVRVMTSLRTLAEYITEQRS